MIATIIDYGNSSIRDENPLSDIFRIYIPTMYRYKDNLKEYNVLFNVWNKMFGYLVI